MSKFDMSKKHQLWFSADIKKDQYYVAYGKFPGYHDLLYVDLLSTLRSKAASSEDYLICREYHQYFGMMSLILIKDTAYTTLQLTDEFLSSLQSDYGSSKTNGDYH